MKSLLLGILEERFMPADEMRVVRSDNADEPPKVVGYAATFGKWSEDLGGFKEKVRSGAFASSIAKDDIRSLFNHDPNYVLGRNKAGTLILEEDSKGLRFEAIPPDTQWARDLMTSIDRGDISGCSFGFKTIKDDWNNRMDERELIECKAFDTGPVTYPAYPSTSVSVRDLRLASMLNNIQTKVDAGEKLTDADREYIKNAIAELGALNSPASEEAPAEEEVPSVDLAQLAKLRLEIEGQY